MSNELPPEITALVVLLGRADATFWPVRGDFVQEAAQVRSGLRRDWRKQGLPMRSTAASTTERKQEEQLWRGLERDGLVTIAAAGGRRSHVRFTFRGELHARRLAATGDVIDGWLFFSALAELFELTGGKQLARHTPRAAHPGGGRKTSSRI